MHAELLIGSTHGTNFKEQQAWSNIRAVQSCYIYSSKCSCDCEDSCLSALMGNFSKQFYWVGVATCLAKTAGQLTSTPAPTPEDVGDYTDWWVIIAVIGGICFFFCLLLYCSRSSAKINDGEDDSPNTKVFFAPANVVDPGPVNHFGVVAEPAEAPTTSRSTTARSNDVQFRASTRSFKSLARGGSGAGDYGKGMVSAAAKAFNSLASPEQNEVEPTTINQNKSLGPIRGSGRFKRNHPTALNPVYTPLESSARQADNATPANLDDGVQETFGFSEEDMSDFDDQ